MFTNKIIIIIILLLLLLTGGTGTFGSAVLRRFLQTAIGEIRIFSRDEKKQHDMRCPKSLLDAIADADGVFHMATFE